MSAVLAMLAAWAIALVINVVPAFMPPTWSVLAAFRIMAGAPLLPLTVGGASASALGRVGLALLCRRFGDKLPETDRENARALGRFVNRHRRWREAIVFFYCLGPLPSNPLFIAAGVGRVPLLPATIAFFAARAIADTFWVWSAGKVSDNLGDVFLKNVTSWQAAAIQLVALALVVLIFRLPWATWLGLADEEPLSASSDVGREVTDREMPRRRGGRRAQRGYVK
jgi:membrane protein YqaA with SNARE-associated domain